MNKAGQAGLVAVVENTEGEKDFAANRRISDTPSIQTRQLAIVQGVLRNPRKRTRPPRTGSPASE
jgi:hypothetical protein